MTDVGGDDPFLSAVRAAGLDLEAMDQAARDALLASFELRRAEALALVAYEDGQSAVASTGHADSPDSPASPMVACEHPVTVERMAARAGGAGELLAVPGILDA